MNGGTSIEIAEPKFSKFIFANTRMSWLWLLVRVYLGWEWLVPGWSKVNNPAWVGAEAGTAIKTFLLGALKKTAGNHPDVSGWYGYFITNVAIPNATLFSYLVAFGEVAVGLALILGAFVGVAAFFGAFMNLNYPFAGTVSISPFMLLLGLFLILAWRNAGWWGLDRIILPALGVPWQPGKLFRK